MTIFISDEVKRYLLSELQTEFTTFFTSSLFSLESSLLLCIKHYAV